MRSPDASFRKPSGPPAAIDSVAVSDATPRAYQWWYFDGLSDDGRFGFVAIYFIGGVFSALYADRVAAGVAASPLDHPMVNLALYDRQRRKVWVYSEYPTEALVVRDPSLNLQIARSSLSRSSAGKYELLIDDDDFVARRPVEVKIVVTPEAPGLAPPGFSLDSAGRHFWGAPAPRCHVTLDSESHGLSWTGSGYHDVNLGSEPLHTGFKRWSWGRAHLRDETRIYYDAEEASGARSSQVFEGREGALAVTQTATGSGRVWTPWLMRVPRNPVAGTIAGEPVSVSPVAVWESSPFYVRTLSRFAAGGESVHGVCEDIDLGRFARPSIRFMLRHRIYRRMGTGLEPLPAQVHRRRVFPHDPG